MSGRLRTKQGCWTCRLRKKKCDESRPTCATCEGLGIVCFGFGDRPEWMDGGEKEKEAVNEIKEIVKLTSRRKGTAQLSSKRVHTMRLAPKNLSSGGEVGSELDEASGQRLTRLGSLREDDSELSMFTSSTTADESVLLMHYLDVVLPLQFPAYKPSIQEGGRGWILALLLREKAFYHAALAVSTYHRRKITLAQLNHEQRTASLVQQGRQLEICLGLVNGFAKNECPYIRLGVTMAVVQLVFFELFTGLSNGWQAHHRASMGVYRRGCNEKLANFGLSEAAREILTDDCAMPHFDPRIAEEVTCFRFLTSTLVWLDIASSITSGTAPYLRLYHDTVFSEKSMTRLEDVMGCKSWVVLQIGRIAAMYHHRTQLSQEGDFEHCANGIARQIQLGLAEDDRMGIEDTSTLITTTFAYMASIYLHLVVRGFQKLEVLDETISATVEILKTKIPTECLPALVCPLYVVGSVARVEEEPLFRSVFKTEPLLATGLKHRRMILPMLEEIWTRRRSTPELKWEDCVAVSCNALLL